ncbi:MAG: GDP-L-fucose synthase [Deltaproteobacteria bacterium]|nr:GDP-L-fucose synthase [Deltaproteobacteria bacterium]MBN2671510.1 GDP-L-fucose synthase [Deltaproteobacteria bacterium]
MNKQSKIYVAGHTGLVGSAICRSLEKHGYENVIGRDISELNLEDFNATNAFFEAEKPEYVILAAAKVGGIVANNTYRADFIHSNLQIQNNVIHSAYLHGVKKLLFLGSSCIYPKNCPQPMREDALLTSPLEYTNEPYAIAKIAGLKMCEAYNLQYGTNFISVMPTNLYGPNDNFDLEKSHVLPALIRKMHLAKLLKANDLDAIEADLKTPDWPSVLQQYGISTEGVTIWGTGTPYREFLYSEDMADACVFVMEHVDFSDLAQDRTEVINTHINIGTGKDLTISELAHLIRDIVGFNGELIFDSTKPDGTPKKLLDVNKLTALGWTYKTELNDGIQKIYDWYLQR